MKILILEGLQVFWLEKSLVMVFLTRTHVHQIKKDKQQIIAFLRRKNVGVGVKILRLLFKILNHQMENGVTSMHQLVI
jgi:hypothetical protein